MKKQVTPSLLFRTFLCALLGIFVFIVPSFSQKTVSKPGKEMLYVSGYNNGPGWTLVRNTYYTYNASGLPIEIYKTDAFNLFVEKKIIYYDAFGNDTLTLTSYMRNGAIQHFKQRNLLTYNSAQKLIEKIWQSTDSAGNWESLDKTTYAYTNGEINEITFTRFDAATATWNNIFKHKNITWHQPTKQKASYVQQGFQNNTWEDAFNYIATFDANGGSVGILQYWMNNAWINSTRTTITHDSLGSEISYLSEYWDNGNWSFSLRNIQPITYSPTGDILEKYSSTLCIACSPASDDKYVYSNFQYFTIAGLKNEIPQEITATIFPNPTQTLLNIELHETAQNVTAQLTDLTGKVIMSQNFRASEQKQLNLENLKAGIYLLNLETEKGKTVRKIIKN
jgi:hypothetical protein